MCTPSQEAKNNGLKALGYEMDQMYEAYRLCEDAQARANAYLESFLLHVRILSEFYARTEREHNDTMLCSDYGIQRDNLTSIEGPLKMKPGEKRIDYKRQLNQRLAHLTYSRSSSDHPDEDWPVREISIQLANQSIEVCSQLVESYEFNGQTRETKEETWRKRQAKLERLKKISKELPPKAYTTNSITTLIHFNRLD